MTIHRDLHNMYQAGFATYVTAAAQDISCSKWGEVFEVTTTGSSDTLTLLRPTKPGIQCTVVLSVDAGDLVLTVTGGYNFDGDTDITFDDAKDMVVLLSYQTGSTYQWMAIAQEGTDAAVESGTFDAITATTGTIGTLTATTATITNPKHVITAVTAVGSVQSLATNDLAPGFNNVKGGGNDLGVSLPTAAAGLEVIVKNTSGSNAIVYGSATAVIINALATTTGFTVATTKTTRLICENSSQWWTDPLAVA